MTNELTGADGDLAAGSVVARYPKPRRKRDRSHLPWRVDYDLIYDGGSSKWSRHYRTRWGARLSIWRHLHISSWGGSADLVSLRSSLR